MSEKNRRIELARAIADGPVFRGGAGETGCSQGTVIDDTGDSIQDSFSSMAPEEAQREIEDIARDRDDDPIESFGETSGMSGPQSVFAKVETGEMSDSGETSGVSGSQRAAVSAGRLGVEGIRETSGASGSQSNLENSSGVPGSQSVGVSTMQPGMKGSGETTVTGLLGAQTAFLGTGRKCWREIKYVRTSECLCE